MIKGEQVRLDIHKILYSIFKSNINLNHISIQKIINRHKQEDISLLNNVLLNSMRHHIHINEIIKLHVNKKLRNNEKVLLLSAITQIVFLDFREYAVINCSVEIAKKFKIYHGFINAVLKKISKNKEKLKNIEIGFKDLPKWFREETKSLSKYEKEKFLKNFNKQPNLHIVFKNEHALSNFEESLIRTSKLSGFLEKKIEIKNINSFKQGDWWVQDFSSFFPIQNIPNITKTSKILDACAAPGGKAFQILSRNIDIVLNDKNKNKIQILQSNLKRLNFDTKIFNKDFTNYDFKQKYNYIVIDAPCSAIGTIRKNPEIFFKDKGPNLEELIIIQERMLEKASLLLHKEGYILYMVCSFLKKETEEQIDKFLRKKNGFELYNFELVEENKEYFKLIKNKFMFTLPDTIFDKNIDGYFAAYLKRTE